MSERLARAWELLRLRRPREAAAEALEGLAANPDDVTAHEMLALAKAAMGDRTGAVDSARDAIRRAPERAYAHYVLAFALRSADRDQEAHRAIERSLALDPDLACALDLCAGLLLARDEPTIALRHSRRAVAMDPEDPDYRTTEVRALRALGRIDEAMAAVASGLRENPNHGHLNQLSGELHLAKDLRRATEAFLTALRADPDNEAAREGLLQALRRRNPLFRVVLPLHRGFAGMVRHLNVAISVLFLLLGTAILSAIAGRTTGNVVFVALVGALLIPTDAANAFLLFHPIGRHLLRQHHRVFAVVVAVLSGTAMAMLTIAWFRDSGEDRATAAVFAGCALLVSFVRVLVDHVRLSFVGRLFVVFMLISVATKLVRLLLGS